MSQADDKIEFLIIQMFKQKLDYDASDYHPILYGQDMVLEFNWKSDYVRPINSSIWFNVGYDKYSLIVEYLKDRCDLLFEKFFKNKEEVDEIIPGYFSDGYIAISLDEIGPVIESDPRLNEVTKLNILDQFSNFHSFLKNIYEESIKDFKQSVARFDHILFPEKWS